jgi:hypothetical protein
MSRSQFAARQPELLAVSRAFAREEGMQRNA